MRQSNVLERVPSTSTYIRVQVIYIIALPHTLRIPMGFLHGKCAESTSGHVKLQLHMFRPTTQVMRHAPEFWCPVIWLCRQQVLGKAGLDPDAAVWSPDFCPHADSMIYR